MTTDLPPICHPSPFIGIALPESLEVHVEGDARPLTLLYRPHLILRTVLEKICAQRGLDLQKMIVYLFLFLFLIFISLSSSSFSFSFSLSSSFSSSSPSPFSFSSSFSSSSSSFLLLSSHSLSHPPFSPPCSNPHYVVPLLTPPPSRRHYKRMGVRSKTLTSP